MEKEIALGLLKIGAVFLRPDEPFTWASGIKSPIYCDNRLTLSHPALRGQIEAGLAQLVQTHHAGCEGLFGTATAGIAHAAIAAHLMQLPMGYVRGGEKDHGRGGKVEGRVEPGQKVVVVEDLISTAGSVVDSVITLRQAGAEVQGVVSIFTYGMAKGTQRLADAGVGNHSLCTLDALLEVAAEGGYIATADIARVKAFRDAPQDAGWMD
ncbi:MAG: orotate phosphoribosyltransferase [Oscillospiraceae bacterium]